MEADKELYLRFVGGDIPAFETLVLSHKDNLIYFISRYVSEIHTCEDIAQEVFAAVYVNKERYDFSVSFKTYLYAIAKNKAVDFIRKAGKIVLLGDDERSIGSGAGTDAEELFDRVVQKEEQRMVHTAIQSLKPDYQRALHMVDLEGMSYHDTASVLGKTIPQLKILVFRARKALKNSLVKGGYTNEK